MKRFIKILLIIISFVVFNSEIIIAQHKIYVHPVTGIDNNNEGRNLNNPIKTLWRAGQVCHGGDSILILSNGGNSTYTRFKDTFYQWDTLGITPVWIMSYNQTITLDGTDTTFRSYEAVLTVRRSRNIVIENLNVRNNDSGSGIQVVSDSISPTKTFITRDVIVRKCTVNNTYRQGILVQASNVTVENCEIYNAVMRNVNGSAGTSGWECSLGTYLWPDMVNCWSNIVFRNNKVHHCWGEGIVALRCYNFTIENNHVYDCFSAYIYIDNSRKGKIMNNWVHSTNDTFNRQYNPEFRAPGAGIQWAAEKNRYGVDSLISDLEIYNNLIVRTNTPISWWRDTSNHFPHNSYKNINVSYNTIYYNYGYESFYLDVNTAGVDTPVNCNFKNNIICKGQYPLGTYRSYKTPSSHYAYWSIDYNCFIHRDNPFNQLHNIQGPPSFVDSNNINIDTNFRIKSTSICKGAAIPFGNITNDYWYAGRSLTTPSIGFHEFGGISGINDPIEISSQYSLSQNYPNPFNPKTIINFNIPRTAKVSLIIYDIFGREIKKLIDSEMRTANNYEISFDGSGFASGVYFYQLTSDEFIQSKKMILIK